MTNLGLAAIDVASLLGIAGLLVAVFKLVIGRLDKRFQLADELRAEGRAATFNRIEDLARRIEAGIDEHKEMRTANQAEHAEIRRSVEQTRSEIIDRDEWARTWGVLDWELTRVRRQLDALAVQGALVDTTERISDAQ